MTLALEGWIDGLSALVLFIAGVSFGLVFMYKSIKTRAKLLFYFGLMMFFAGFLWLGGILDFFTILITDKNMDNTYGIKGILGYMWLAPLAITMIYIGTELIIPERKRIILTAFIISGVFFYIFLLLDPLGSLSFIYPEKPGEKLIDFNSNLFSPFGIIVVIYFLSFFFIGGGFLYKGLQSEGIIRKKFVYLTIANFLFVSFGLIEAILILGIALIFIRIGIFIIPIFWYLGLREVSVKKHEIKPIKEVKVEGDLFRLSETKPGEITEEEVVYHKEQEICLICKGKVDRFCYICPDCRALYCEKCAHALTKLENACWVCNVPFDKSKPSKPFEKAEEEIGIEISDKVQKTPKK